MAKMSYYLPSYDKGCAGYGGLYAFLTYWKNPDCDFDENDPGETLEDLDEEALEKAKTYFGMAEPKIIKRFETNEDCVNGEVRYLIIEASSLPAPAPSEDDSTF